MKLHTDAGNDGRSLSANKRGKAILCIDDDPDTCEMLSILLGQAGYDVTRALNVSEGLALARQGGFALILLDWYLPDGTGIELCQRIRQFDKLTPILFYSGEAHRSEIQKALALGADGYLVKPVAMDDLFSAISEHIAEPGQ